MAPDVATRGRLNADESPERVWYVHRSGPNEITVGLAPDEDYEAVWRQLSHEDGWALVAALQSALRLSPIASIVNMAMHPTKVSRALPRSRWRRAWLVLRGYELYGP